MSKLFSCQQILLIDQPISVWKYMMLPSFWCHVYPNLRWNILPSKNSGLLSKYTFIITLNGFTYLCISFTRKQIDQ